MGAALMCTFGMAPSVLAVIRPKMVVMTPMANIMDNKPMANIAPFGMCTSLLNPQVASATAAALGVLTPMACTPTIPAPWLPGHMTVLIDNQPALNKSSILMCAYGGVIQIQNPGQTIVELTMSPAAMAAASDAAAQAQADAQTKVEAKKKEMEEEQRKKEEEERKKEEEEEAKTT